MNLIEQIKQIESVEQVDIESLLIKKELHEAQLKMVQKAIKCANFLIDYFKLVDGREVDIVVTAKEVDLTNNS